MITNTTPEAFISYLSANLGVRYTDEQREMIANIDKPMFVYADPGTGKTATVTAGLIFAECYKQIPGESIIAVSFTNDATAELANRHKNTCAKLRMRETVNFKTLHKICTALLKENYKLLGMESLTICSNYDYERIAKVMLSSAKELGVNIKDTQVRKINEAIKSANSSLTFGKDTLESRMYFKEARIDYEDFMILRKLMYDYNKLARTIQVSDIMLYTLQLLTQHPEIATEFKKKCRLLIVDESQDMSLLQLQLIALLADNVVFVGDMKQQIYGFNGACAEVSHYFKVFFPEAKVLALSQSFRCDDEIVNFARPIILPNEVGGENFKGTGPGGRVNVINDMDLSLISTRVLKDMEEHKGAIYTDIMVLYRNNYSSIPVIDHLYSKGVPVRCNKYEEAFKLPVVRELCELIELARNPSDTRLFGCLRYIIPELQRYGKNGNMRMIEKIQELNTSLFGMKWNFQDEYTGNYGMEILLTVREMLLDGAKLTEVMNTLWPLYNEHWLTSHEWMLEYPAMYYMKLIEPIIRGKTYDQFINVELAKMEDIKKANRNLFGVRCSTFHSAKGLEADAVYMLDVDCNTVPNAKKMKQMIDAGALVDVARSINNERSLLFVAATRARHELYISYDSSIGLSKLITNPESYEAFDNVYKNYKQTYGDIGIFNRFCETSCKDMRAMLAEVNRIADVAASTYYAIED